MPGFSSMANAVPSVGHCEKSPGVTPRSCKNTVTSGEELPLRLRSGLKTVTSHQAHVSLKVMAAPLAEHANLSVKGETEKP